MILRLSQKLNTKIKAGKLDEKPLDENPYADWSCHLFTADRTQYIIMSNTKSLYSCVMYGKGITDDSRFIERALSTIREFMEDDGQAFAYQRFIAPASGTVSFAKALNRSVTGSMNDLIKHAQILADRRRNVAARSRIPAQRHPDVGVGDRASKATASRTRLQGNARLTIDQPNRTEDDRANDQLHEEVNYPHLAAFLRAGGTLEVGEDFSLGSLRPDSQGQHDQSLSMRRIGTSQRS